jgi:LysR family transcriptional regulator of gallate degradation
MPIPPTWPALADELKSLRALCAVAASGSTARAAQCLHLTQPSVARAIQALERRLGEPLFDRTARGMAPLPVAQGLTLRAQRALQCLAAVAPPTRRPPADDALGWTGSRVAAGAGARHLAVMFALCDSLSQTQAGRALGISQSAVQQTLAQLEHMAGSPLFLRTRHGLRPTEEGDALLKAFMLARAELAQAGEELAHQRGLRQGRIVIGTLPFSTGRLLSQAVDDVLAQHPGLGVTIIDGTFEALVHKLRHAEIDLIAGALRAEPPGPDLVQHTLFEDRLAVVARAQHPLAGRSRLRWSALRGATWIMPMPNTPAQAAFEQALAHAGLALPADPLRVNSALMMVSLLLQGDRLALMSPRHVERELREGLLCELPVAVQHAPRRIGYLRRADYLPTPAAQSLFDALERVGRAIGSGPPERRTRHRRV